jgi:hypothetical protein
LRDFDLAYVGLGSDSTELAEATRPLMSAMPPTATKLMRHNQPSLCAKTCHDPLPCACESDVALRQSCQRDVPRSYFCSGSGDAVGRHLTQTFNFAVCSHRVNALNCAREIAKSREGTP